MVFLPVSVCVCGEGGEGGGVGGVGVCMHVCAQWRARLTIRSRQAHAPVLVHRAERRGTVELLEGGLQMVVLLQV